MNDNDFFSSLHPSLKYVLASWNRWEDLRGIQKKTLQAFLTGSDLLILSPTAGGKSEAAFIPVLDQVLKKGDTNLVCLYIAPLKALINDIAERLQNILTPLQCNLLVCHGDAPLTNIPESPVFLLTTPETLMVLLYRRDNSLLSHVRYCIIDELHALAATVRGSQVLAALSRIEDQNDSEIMRIGLSATVGNPEEVLEWMKGRDNGILVTEDKKSRDFIFHLYSVEKTEISEFLSNKLTGKHSLVFTGSRKESENLANIIRNKIPNVFVHHSSLSSDIRRKTEEKTRQGSPFVVICTSTLELGIDIGDLDLVVQIGSLKTISSFLQRLGRTGRRDIEPVMFFLSSNPEETCHILSALMGAKCGMVEPVIPPRYPYDLLVREILLLVLTRHRISKARIDSLLLKKPYRSISKTRLQELLSHLITYEWISLDGDLIIPGLMCEKFRTRQGFLFSLIGDQYSTTVISSDGEEIGTIPKPSQDLDSFILGGMVWQQTSLENGNALVVRPSGNNASPPVWKGSSAEVSLLILSGIRSLISGIQIPFPVTDTFLEDLNVFKKEFPSGLNDNSLLISHTSNRTIIYTFLGKTWNRIIGVFIEKNYKNRYISSDLYQITFSGNVTSQIIHQGFLKIREGTWEDLAEYAPMPLEKNDLNFNLLPYSCIREQWCIDSLKIPLLLDVLKGLKLE